MAKVISQETFDGVVQENVEEFEMSLEDALSEAISQFEAQGVNLANIVKDVSHFSATGDNKHAVIMAVEKINILIRGDDFDGVSAELRVIKEECDRDLAHRCLAAKHGAYISLIQCLKGQKQILLVTLDALASLTNGQPDVLTDEGVDLLLDLLQSSDPEIIAMVTKVIIHVCTKHETNRQTLVSKDLITLLVSALERNKTDGRNVKLICCALRTLTLDDDVRVPFGKSHDHAKLIVTEAGALKKLLNLSADYSADKAVLSELFGTISCLVVRNEFCQEIMDLGGLHFVLSTLESSMSHQGLVKQILGVLKAISGNDQVKVAIVAQNGAPLIVTATDKHIKQASVAEMSCSAVASIVLRNPAHCKVFMECQVADVIVKAMQLHADKSGVQKKACMAVRNLVARSREYSDAFLVLGVEDLIREAIRRHEDCQDEGKAALRDLDLKVNLIERWTGQGQGITY
ncbi:hypothetical protein CAPTEDRAFT_184330 [Capitella teleta]|uniref:Armadillo repeat-containing protein 6 n=1 Tax=Capitella teleta TaxID=283909 RepID=R7UFP9_CAPTE|nr:hypothetical protein CAPTEDRAFT_184330 [Capitella teleta]|eukprot:ELU02618.1 hypothetical protein CAPTEDRAFT_184330 [Capitella teleta]